MSKELEDLKLIREMMERSSKFISLSGLSGIIAGVIALIGTGVVYYMFSNPDSFIFFRNTDTDYMMRGMEWALVVNVLIVGTIVLVLSLGVGIFFSYRKAHRLNQPLVNKTSLRVLYNMSIPLITGGVITLLFIQYVPGALAMTLIFYGLALINVSKFTYEEVHYLGLTEILLGLMSLANTMLFNPEVKYALIFWGIGFGICHIVYGATMYIKYDLEK